MAATVTLDLQAVQSAGYRERGIARYALDYVLALHRRHPDMIGQVVLRPDLPPAGGLEELVGKVTTTPQWRRGDVFHAMSPFDLDVPASRIWPREAAAAGMRVVATVYDLIPDLMPDVYLMDPGTRRRYRARRELVRAVDHVVTLSETVARDVVDRLGVTDVTMVGGSCAERFRPDPDGGARDRVTRALPGLGSRTVVYNGAIEPRKNVEGLLEAFALLGQQGLQLVLVCRLSEPERHHLEVRAAQLGVDLLLTGEVSDDVLVDLYRSAELAVMPSLMEGYGLPAAEAMACGCPVIASAGTALAELVHPDATFDPRDRRSMATAIEGAVSVPELRAALVSWSAAFTPSWEPVADRAAEVYERLAALPPRAWPKRPRVAVLTPVPPAPTGVAGYSARLVPELERLVDVDVFADGDEIPDGELPARHFAPVGGARGGYDAVLSCLGNSEFHAGALRAVLQPPAWSPAPAVLAHEVRFTELYRHGEPRGAVPGSVAAAARAMYPGMPERWVDGGWVPPDVAGRNGVLMAREIIARAGKFLVTSEYAAALARVEARPSDAARIAVAEFAYPSGVSEPPKPPTGPPVIASFGIVNGLKQPVLLVEAVAALRRTYRLDASLALVGPIGPAERADVTAAAGRLDCPVEMTGHVPEPVYGEWFGRAALAVQLRSSTNGEVSGAVADCITHGLPTVATAIGPTASMPGFIRKVRPGIGADELAEVLAGCLSDSDWRRSAAADGLAYAAARTFAGAAARLVELLEL